MSKIKQQQHDGRGFGRIVSKDDRDRKYLVSPILKAYGRLDGASKDAVTRGFRYWADGAFLDQQDTPMCVGFAWAHFLGAGPITNKTNVDIAQQIYREAQDNDEWDGNAYDGTSVRGGAKALVARASAPVTEYRWALSVEEMAQAILTIGPMVVGTDWYAGMMRPEMRTGMLKATGKIVGGHAYLLSGVNTSARFFRIKNSWSREWGVNGRAWISFADMQQLIDADGEACIAVERKTK